MLKIVPAILLSLMLLVPCAVTAEPQALPDAVSPETASPESLPVAPVDIIETSGTTAAPAQPEAVPLEAAPNNTVETGAAPPPQVQLEPISNIPLDTPDPSLAAGPVAVSDTGEIPESTIFDLYLSESFQGSILASYTESWFQIDNPQDVLEQLRGLKTTDKLVDLCSGRIGKVKSIEGIGSIRYDLNTFRIVLKLESSFFETKKLDLMQRLPDPENKFSLQQAMSVYANGSIDEANIGKGTLAHRTTASVGRYYGITNGSFVREDRYVMSEASAGGIVSDFSIRGGLLETQGQTFGRSAEYAGVKVETSKDIILSQQLLRGSALKVFIPARARVRFLRGDQLLSVQILDFGLQEVDTSDFPDGSYDVDILIEEDNGATSRERKFFTKSSFLAIQSKPIYTLAFGAIRNQLDILSSHMIGQAGVRWRAARALEVNASLYGTDQASLAELGALTMYGDTILGMGLSASDEGRIGVSGRLGGRLYGVNLYGGASHTLNGVETPEAPGTVDRETLLSDIDLLKDKRTSVAIGASKGWGPFDFSLSYYTNRTNPYRPEFMQTDDPETFTRTESRAAGPEITWRLISGNRNYLALQTSYLDTDRGRKFFSGLTYRHTFDKHYSLQSNLRGLSEDTGDTLTSNNALNINMRDRTQKGSDFSFSEDVDARRKDETDISSASQASWQREGDYLRSGLYARSLRDTFGEHHNSYGVNAVSGFIYGQDAGFSISATAQTEAVLVVELKGDDLESDFDLILNDQAYEKIRPGRRTAISVSPYQTYEIRLRPSEGSELVDFQGETYSVTFFPGNVVKKTWSADRVFLALGKLLDDKGLPIPRKRIRGARDYAVTEEDGSFQAEITGKEPLYIDGPTGRCDLALSVPEKRENLFVHDFGTVSCQLPKVPGAES